MFLSVLNGNNSSNLSEIMVFFFGVLTNSGWMLRSLQLRVIDKFLFCGAVCGGGAQRRRTRSCFVQHWCMKKLWENIKLVETLDCVACPLKRAKCALWKVLLSKSFQYLVYTFVLLPIHSVLFLRLQLKIASFWHPTWNQN